MCNYFERKEGRLSNLKTELAFLVKCVSERGNTSKCTLMCKLYTQLHTGGSSVKKGYQSVQRLIMAPS